MLSQAVALFLLFTGTCLLALAAWPSTLRPAGIETETQTQFEKGIELDPDEAARQLRDATGNNLEYLRAVNSVVHRTIAHYWPPRIAESDYNARVPLTENYILWAAAHLPGRYGRHFRTYNLTKYERAFERGFGECAQFVYALRDVLRRTGIESRHQSLDGHVVAVVDLNGEEVVADPDYGVVVPHSLDEVRENPSLVREWYADASSIQAHVDREEYPLEYVETLYEPPYADFDPDEYHLRAIERTAYALVWVVPVVLLVTALLLWVG